MYAGTCRLVHKLIYTIAEYASQNEYQHAYYVWKEHFMCIYHWTFGYEFLLNRVQTYMLYMYLI